jgi:hypothetical protein
MSLSMSLDDRADDLPKALRNASLRTSDDIGSTAVSGVPGDLQGAVVTDIRIPYWRLVLFLMKVALAALPALLIVALILYGVAEVMGTLFPQLVKLKIQIYVPPN